MSEQQIVQRIAAKAVIVNEAGKVLLLREAPTYVEGTNHGKYGLPGGRINPGEVFLDGLKREVAEETGLEVRVVRPVHVDEWRPVIKGVLNQIVGMFMLCEPVTREIVLSEEHDDYRWIDPGETDDYEMMPAEVRAIKAWRMGLAGR
jgi:8-oxo-dGTP diphosphatase